MSITTCNMRTPKSSDSSIEGIAALGTCFGMLVLVFAIYPAIWISGALINGFVIHNLWEWFVTPLCGMLVAPPWLVCSGLSLLVERLVNYQPYVPEKTPHWSHSLFVIAMYALVAPWFVLGLGYLIHLYC
jgi:hypothetical protein